MNTIKTINDDAYSWRMVDLGPRGEWFMGKLTGGAEKPLRRLPEDYSYQYADAEETYYSWYRLIRWRHLTDEESAALNAALTAERGGK